MKNLSIIGLYGECENGYLACSQLELNADSTFEYYIFWDVGGGQILKGVWYTNNDTIILNTFNQPKFINSQVYENINPKILNKKRILIRGSDNIPFGYAAIWINDNIEEQIADSNGIYYSIFDSIYSIKITFLFYEEKIKIKNSLANDIEIVIKDLNWSGIPEFLVNEKILIKNNKIYFHTNSGKFNKNLYLRKTKIINKMF